MREMKDSGVPWIGDIPADWDVSILSALLGERRHKNTGLTERNLLSLSYGKVIKKDIDSNEGLLPASFEAYNVIERGDIVLRLTDLQNDKRSLRTGLCAQRGIITSAYTTLAIRSNDDPAYMHYLLHAYDICKVFYGMGDGVRQGMNYSDLKSLRVIRPSLAEQKRIADFLDTKCAKIDAIIARQQQVIEKLKAYKLSVITEAVTKGLNPDVPMKDSGIEWIGLVPKHWTVSTLRNGLSDIQTGPFGSQLHAADYIENGIFVVNPANIVNGVIVPDSRCSISDEKAQELEQHILLPGDVVFARRGEMGRCACVPADTDRYFCGTGCIRLKCNAMATPQFATDYLQIPYVKQYLELHSVGTTMSNLNSHIIAGIPMLFPPVAEQEVIHAFITDKSEAINGQIKKKVLLIDKLNEYKKSLIYEVVTGKREIKEDLSAVTSVAVLAPALIAELREKRAALMTRFIDGLGDKNKGRTQIQKCMSLAEGLIDLQLGTQLVRQHYGPYDEDIQTYEQIMAEHEWMNHTKKKGRIQYTHGKRFQEYHSVYQRFFGNYDREIQRIIDFVKPIKRTSEIGRMATLFAAWNDFILDGNPNPTDEQIISEVRSNWTDNKANTPVETWQDSLNKLRAAGMVPCGYGRHTVKLEEGDHTHG